MSVLVRFHEAMAPFLRGDISAAELEQRLGPSPSGTSRLALYPRLVRRQSTGLVDHFFRALAAALERHEPGSFSLLRDAFLAAYPLSSWEPNENLRPFAPFVKTYPNLPEWAFELADFTWSRFLAAHADRTTGEVGLDLAVFVRHYRYDVASAFDEATPSTRALVLAPRTMVFARHRRTGRLVFVTPSVAALYALLGASGEELPPLPTGIGPHDVDRELLALREAGILVHGEG